jgi:hypothetical protein
VRANVSFTGGREGGGFVLMDVWDLNPEWLDGLRDLRGRGESR